MFVSVHYLCRWLFGQFRCSGMYSCFMPLGISSYFFLGESRPAVGPTEPPIQWVQGGPFHGDKAAEV
jgi:hypothetical protein